MPLIIRRGAMSYKSPTTGGYVDIDAVGSGSGGGGQFLITITFTGNGNNKVYSSDKTVAEIIEAIEAEKTLYICDNEDVNPGDNRIMTCFVESYDSTAGWVSLQAMIDTIDFASYSVWSSNGSEGVDKYPDTYVTWGNGGFVQGVYDGDTNLVDQDGNADISPAIAGKINEQEFAPTYLQLTFPISKGQRCLNEGVYYIANQNIPSQESFDYTHWDMTNMDSQLGIVKSALNDKLNAPSTAGTSGQVLSLDNNLDPVWTTPSGGGGGADIDDTAGAGVTNKAWSANKLVGEFADVEDEIDGAYSHQYAVAINGWSDSAVTYSDTGFINSSGTVTANSTFRYSNNIPCAEGDLIYYNLYGYKSQVYLVTFYNASNQRISGIVGQSAYQSGSVYAPENTAYVVFSTNKSSAGTFTKSVIQRVPGDSLKSELLSYTDSKTNATDTGITLTRADLPIISGSYFTSSGIYTQTAGRRTDYIPAAEGDTVSFRCHTYIGTSVVVRTVAAFDANKNIIGHSTAQETGIYSGTYTAPSGTAYLMISWDWAMQYDGWFEIHLASYTQALEDLVRSSKRVPYSPLNGKQWCCLGDSITYGANTTKTYFNYISDRCAVTPWNFGASNTAIAKSSSSVTNNMATRYADMYNDADYITVFGGTNDHGQNITIGQWGDTEQTTLYGAMKVLCDGLVSKYPNKKIGFIIPLPKRAQIGGVYTDYSYPNESFYPYIQCIEDVCKRYSIPYLDLYTGSGIAIGNSDVREALMADGIHPKAEGHEFISRKIQAFLESL